MATPLAGRWPILAALRPPPTTSRLPSVRLGPALVGFVLAIALLAAGFSILAMPWQGDWFAAGIAALLVALLATYSVPSFGGVRAHWSAAGFVHLAFSFTVGPPAILAMAVSEALAIATVRRPGAFRTVFNLTNYFVSNTIAWLSFRALIGPRPGAATLALAGLTGAFCYTVSNKALLICAQRLAGEPAPLRAWLHNLAVTAPIYVAFGVAASSATPLNRAEPTWGIITLVLPVAIFQAALVVLTRRAEEKAEAQQREADALVREAAALRRAAEASTREREQIAAGIHDGVVQDLAGLSFRLDGYAGVDPASLTPDQAAAVVRLVAQASATTREAARDLRTLLIEIAPPRLRAHGLEAALGDLADALVPGPTPEIRLVVCEEACPDEASRALAYRVAQEALRNCVKHAGATAIEITVTRDGADLVVRIRDDGRGFSFEDLARRQEHGHVGLSLLERTALDGGGTLHVDSTPGTGTLVELRVAPGCAAQPDPAAA
jgi:signal transduction histidine kinase